MLPLPTVTPLRERETGSFCVFFRGKIWPLWKVENSLRLKDRVPKEKDRVRGRCCRVCKNFSSPIIGGFFFIVLISVVFSFSCLPCIVLVLGGGGEEDVEEGGVIIKRCLRVC